MPIPHRTQQQMIKRRLVGKEGSERVRELRAILRELPSYKNGPYADLRKWVNARSSDAPRARVVHRDSIAVRREVPRRSRSSGRRTRASRRSSRPSDVQIKTGDYAFTTTRSGAGTTRIGGVLIQLVEIPGLIEGAAEDRGGGRALTGVLETRTQ